MKKYLPIILLLKNKYIIASLIFIVFMLFLDHNDFFSQLQRRRELNELKTTKKFYIDEIEKIKKDLADLQNNPKAIENYAREKFYMKRENEDIYIIENPTAKKDKK